MRRKNILILTERRNMHNANLLRSYLKKKRSWLGSKLYEPSLFTKDNLSIIKSYLSRRKKPVIVTDCYNTSDSYNSLIGEQKPYIVFSEDLYNLIETNNPDSIPTENTIVVKNPSASPDHPFVNISFSSLDSEEDFRLLEEEIREQSRRRRENIKRY